MMKAFALGTVLFIAATAVAEETPKAISTAKERFDYGKELTPEQVEKSVSAAYKYYTDKNMSPEDAKAAIKKDRNEVLSRGCEDLSPEDAEGGIAASGDVAVSIAGSMSYGLGSTGAGLVATGIGKTGREIGLASCQSDPKLAKSWDSAWENLPNPPKASNSDPTTAPSPSVPVAQNPSVPTSSTGTASTQPNAPTGSVAQNAPAVPTSPTNPVTPPATQTPKSNPPSSIPPSTASQAPPSYGPLSPNPGEPAGPEVPQGGAHVGGPLYSVSYEAPASAKGNAGPSESEGPSNRKTGLTTPALVASNFSVAKEAMDEKVASGAVSPAVADALLARLKPVLETEPNLVKALDTVHESIKQRTLPSEPISSSNERLQSAVGSARVVGDTRSAVSASPLAKGPSEVGKESAPAAKTPLTAPGLILASAALLQKNEFVPEAAKNASQSPSKKPGEKAEPSLIVKSAGSLSLKGPQSGSFFPPLPSKALSNGTNKLPQETTAAKPSKSKISGILANIASLFSGRSVTDHSKARAISSLGAQNVESESVSHDASLALASLDSSGIDLDVPDDGYDQEFLAVGLGAFGTCFSGALLGFVFWYRKRPKKSAL